MNMHVRMYVSAQDTHILCLSSIFSKHIFPGPSVDGSAACSGANHPRGTSSTITRTHLGGQHHLDRLLQPHKARQTLRATKAGDDAQLQLRQAQARAGRADTGVACHGHLQAAAQRHPLCKHVCMCVSVRVRVCTLPAQWALLLVSAFTDAILSLVQIYEHDLAHLKDMLVCLRALTHVQTHSHIETKYRA